MRCSSYKISVITSFIISLFALLSVPFIQAPSGAEEVDKSGEIKGDNTLEALIRVANERQEDWHVRVKALDALAASGSPMVTDTLMDAAFNACPAIKWHAVVGLGNYGSDARVVDVLISALDDPTMFIREAAIESLGKIRAGKALHYIDSALRDSHFAIRLKAVAALKNIGGKEALLSLERAADKEVDPFIKNEAAAAARRLAVRQGTDLRL